MCPEALNSGEVAAIEQERDGYLRFHRLIYLKSVHGVAALMKAWPHYSRQTRALLLQSLDAEDAAIASSFLAERILDASIPDDRDLIVGRLARFRRLHDYVSPLIRVYDALPTNLRYEVEWYLAESGTAEGLRFLEHLPDRNKKADKPTHRAAKSVGLRRVSTDRRKAVNSLAERFRQYYVPVDEYSITAWLSQFETEADRILMLRILEHVRFFDTAMIDRACNALWQALPSEVRARASVVGLGPEYKSGHHLLFEFRPDGCPRERVVMSLEKALRSEGEGGDFIVFLDDIIGSGTQAVKFSRALENREAGWSALSDTDIRRLRNAKRYYLALAGFTRGIEKVRQARVFDSVSVAVELDDTARAFSPQANIFNSMEELRQAKEVATFLGSFLYPAKPGSDPDVGPGPLGYESCEALVVFHYNTPNNTLPILWQRGRIGMADWAPLFPRR